jgi:hypothetical protein
MTLPVSYLLPALDGTLMERGCVLQDIRDRGILEGADLTAFCFKVEALLEAAETKEAELKKDLIEAVRHLKAQIEIVFDDLCMTEPVLADLFHKKRLELLEELEA